jgi:hypothetical protein
MVFALASVCSHSSFCPRLFFLGANRGEAHGEELAEFVGDVLVDEAVLDELVSRGVTVKTS